MTIESKPRSRVRGDTVFTVSTLLATMLVAGCNQPHRATTSSPAANPSDQKAVRMYAAEVATAADRLLEITPPEQRVLLALPFDSKKRVSGRETENTPQDAPPFCAVLDWCLVGWGLPQGSMDQQQLVAMHKMLSLSLLKCARNQRGEILGFCGVHDGNIEMLFISPESRGTGIGALLVDDTVQNQGATKVDVNEQNGQALGFYEHLGFRVVGRSPLDGQGRPYPLLHMELGKE